MTIQDLYYRLSKRHTLKHFLCGQGFTCDIYGGTNRVQLIVCMVPSVLSDLSVCPSALFLATRPEASTDKSDNAQRNYTLIVLLCFLLRSMRMRESHVVVSRWLKVELKVTPAAMQMWLLESIRCVL